MNAFTEASMVETHAMRDLIPWIENNEFINRYVITNKGKMPAAEIRCSLMNELIKLLAIFFTIHLTIQFMGLKSRQNARTNTIIFF